MTRRIIAVCSLCGHHYSSMFNDDEQSEHMASAHGMHFCPGNIGHPPHWYTDVRHRTP